MIWWQCLLLSFLWKPPKRNILSHASKMGHTDSGFYMKTCIWRSTLYLKIHFLCSNSQRQVSTLNEFLDCVKPIAGCSLSSLLELSLLPTSTPDSYLQSCSSSAATPLSYLCPGLLCPRCRTWHLLLTFTPLMIAQYSSLSSPFSSLEGVSQKGPSYSVKNSICIPPLHPILQIIKKEFK